MRRTGDFMPILPFVIERDGKSKNVSGLIDSGATVNVLPYKIGLELGFV